MSSAKYPRNGALRARECTLIIIDVQEYCAAPGKGCHEHVNPDKIQDAYKYFFDRLENTTLPAIQEILTAFRSKRKETEVIYTYIESLTKDGRDQSLDYKLTGFNVPKGDPGAQILEQIKPMYDEIMIPKTACSVFNSTNIEYVLRNLGSSQVVICGILTNQCIESAVRDAADRGFYVIVPEEAIATKNQLDHDQSLKNMKGFARICSYRDIVAEVNAM